MGTRADFYVGRGLSAEWIGSIAYDGYPFDQEKLEPHWKGGVKQSVLGAVEEAAYRKAVAECLKVASNAGTKPEQGWPWPWPTSHMTDYAYAFDEGRVWMSVWGSEWREPAYPDYDDSECDDGEDRAVFPNMTHRMRVVPPGQRRSGTFML